MSYALQVDQVWEVHLHLDLVLAAVALLGKQNNDISHPHHHVLNIALSSYSSTLPQLLPGYFLQNLMELWLI